MEQFYKSREFIGASVGIVSILLAISPNYIFLLAVALLSCLMAFELSRALGIKNISLFSPVVFLLSCYNLGIGLLFSLLISFIKGYRSWNLDELLKSLTIFIYSGALPSYLYTVKSSNDYELVKLLLFVWSVDVFAYYAGKTLGKTPFFPKLSPKKTWEGFFGGFFVGSIVFVLTSNIPLFRSVLLGTWLVLLAVSGDLFKSFIKRQVGIKDFSSILGEHGGFTDRFDSLLFVAPVYSLFLN
ncbi:MAG: phosphatidate cytidylyltransferase [Aquificaceae bacterium]